MAERERGECRLGTRITVMAQDGSVVVVFEGNEPDGAGCLDMEKLHEAAVCGPGEPRPATP